VILPNLRHLIKEKEQNEQIIKTIPIMVLLSGRRKIGQLSAGTETNSKAKMWIWLKKHQYI